MMQHFFEYSDEVKSVIQARKPVLALESTIISHGMPYPENYETAIAVEEIARQEGATPATIAIMQGKIKIGLSRDELQRFSCDRQVQKASCRDIAYFLSRGLSAGTTVAATLFCAARAGIKVFATGGIGGVHRGESLDISADLTELAKTPIAIVCAGAKSILDLARTLEFLETMSVPVIGFRTKTFPAFYTDVTQYPLTVSTDDVSSLAEILNMHWMLGMTSGVLIANPIPSEYAIPAEVIDPVIAHAIHQAQQKNISGKALTPFLLGEIAQLTRGHSLHANIALIKNNVRLGAQIACVI